MAAQILLKERLSVSNDNGRLGRAEKEEGRNTIFHPTTAVQTVFISRESGLGWGGHTSCSLFDPPQGGAKETKKGHIIKNR